MNERYLFKAKRTDNGEWVEGFLVKGKWYLGREVYAIIPLDLVFYPACEISEWIEVDQSTICQCTALKDKNGKLIWENDIVSDECGNMAEIIWNDAELQYLVDYEFEPMTLGEWCSVVGNIFDNPELLEVGE